MTECCVFKKVIVKLMLFKNFEFVLIILNELPGNLDLKPQT